MLLFFLSVISSSSFRNVWLKVLCSISFVFIVALLLLRGLACVFAWRKRHLRAGRGQDSDNLVSLSVCENQDGLHFTYQMKVGATATDLQR